MPLSASRPQIRRRAAPINGSGKATPREPPPSEAGLANYIAEMSGELAKLAQRGRMPMLSYFLSLARVEAEGRARERGEQQARRRTRTSV